MPAAVIRVPFRRTGETRANPASFVSPLMRHLSLYVASAIRHPLPEDVTEKAKHHILDTLAAMVSGANLLPGKVSLKYVHSLGGVRQASVVGSKFVTSVLNAAFANAMQAHADETDDAHAGSLTHPGCSNVSAVLAMAERQGASGTAIIRAVTLGYDITARMGMCLGGNEFGNVGHLTHCFGPSFGVAAATAALAGLNAAQIRHVFSYTAQQVGGLATYPRDVDHIEKAFDFGALAVRNGICATTLVEAGCSGVNDVFSGERNFFMAFDESRRTGRPLQPKLLVQRLGTRFEIMHTNIKRWSVGSPIQAALDSLYDLIQQNAIKAENVTNVTVRTYSYGAKITNNREMPDVCMQHLCAVMLLDGFVSFEAAHDRNRMRDPRILKIRKRITLIGDDSLQKLFPERHAIVSITLANGKTLTHRTRAVRGTVENPMTRQEVDQKCYNLMAPALGKKRSRKLCDVIWELQKLKTVKSLRPLLQA